MVCKRILISGRVQGVSFRFYSHEKASEFGLKGWVHNLSDGKVEMLLAGPQEEVDAVIKWAHKGPPAAHVVAVEIHDLKENFPVEPFYIRL